MTTSKSITPIAVLAEDGERRSIRRIVISNLDEAERESHWSVSPPSYYFGSVECKPVDGQTFELLDGSGKRLKRA